MKLKPVKNDSTPAVSMSVFQEREEAEGHRKSVRHSESAAAHSYGTRKEDSMDDAIPTTHSNAGPQTYRPPSPVPSCMSLKTDKSMDYPPKFSNEPKPSGVNLCNELQADLTQDQSRCGVCEQEPRDPVITTTCGHSFCRQCIGSYWEQPGPPGDQACPQCGKKSKTQSPYLDEHTDMAENQQHLKTDPTIIRSKQGKQILRRVIKNHKDGLKRRFQNISEGFNKPGTQKTLNEIYTELYITEGESEGVNKEHEVWQVELASRAQTTEDTPINCNEIFKPLPGQEKHIRNVMTKGVAGIGKTVSVQKFILDWTDGVANQDIDFMFPLAFRELNLVRNDLYSLHSLLLDFYPELRELNDGEQCKDCQIVFIFDGLDESRISLNFQPKLLLSDIKQISTVDMLITSLIHGALLPRALIWITSRPAAVSQIPSQCINRLTEVRGFNDPQKEEYFRKRISDESQANRVISHIKASRSLHIMCHIPVFCWIVATVLQEMLEQNKTQEIPKTLTEMFIHFLLIQTTRKYQKYESQTQTNKEQLLESQRDVILKLAELAFKHLENRSLIFYEDDLRECGINISEASVYSGMCTEIFKEESMFHHNKVYCFVHLSIQEFLAALHIFVSYSNQMETMGTFFCLGESLKFAVTKVLESRNGHLDLFLRFLMGISLESNQTLLQGLLNKTLNSSKSIEEACQHIKELNREDLSPERCINLFHCLIEMNDHSIHDEIQRFLKSTNSFKQRLSPAHCSALAHVLLMSNEVLDEFDPKKYITSDEGRRRLLPAMRCFRVAQLSGCKFRDKSCETVACVLQSPNSLIELNLTDTDLGDSGVQLISAGLSSHHCRLLTLRLAGCTVTETSCVIIASVLQSPNTLLELDLSHNDLGDKGVQNLSVGLCSSHCKMERLRLSACLISENGSGCLASCLASNPSHLIELDLSYNHPGESGLKLLSARLEDPHCKLEILKTDHCAEIRLTPGVRKYACELTLDPNTAGRNLFLSEGNRKVTCLSEKQPYPDHPERFDWWHHVLCQEGLFGCSYWEAEWIEGGGQIAVVYKSIKRKGRNDDSLLGYNYKSWTLRWSPHSYCAKHNNVDTVIPAPSSGSRRVGVYLNWPAGILSFYSVSSDTLTHLHTFHSTFTEPIYPGFWVQPDSSVSLCQIK